MEGLNQNCHSKSKYYDTDGNISTKEHMKTNEKIHRTRQDHQPIAVIANRHPQIKKPGTEVGLPDASGSLLESALDAELSLPELIGAGVLNFKLLECTSKLGLDLSFRTTLQLHTDVW